MGHNVPEKHEQIKEMREFSHHDHKKHLTSIQNIGRFGMDVEFDADNLTQVYRADIEGDMTDCNP